MMKTTMILYYILHASAHMSNRLVTWNHVRFNMCRHFCCLKWKKKESLMNNQRHLYIIMAWWRTFNRKESFVNPPWLSLLCWISWTILLLLVGLTSGCETKYRYVDYKMIEASSHLTIVPRYYSNINAFKLVYLAKACCCKVGFWSATFLKPLVYPYY